MRRRITSGVALAIGLALLGTGLESGSSRMPSLHQFETYFHSLARTEVRVNALERIVFSLILANTKQPCSEITGG